MNEIEEEKYEEWKNFIDNEFRKILKETNFTTLDLSIVLGKILYIILNEKEIPHTELDKIFNTEVDLTVDVIIPLITRVYVIFDKAKHLELGYRCD